MFLIMCDSTRAHCCFFVCYDRTLALVIMAYPRVSSFGL